MNYSEGPWTVSEQEPMIVVDADLWTGCSTTYDNNHGRQTCRANARLIALAPEMLEMLRNFAAMPFTFLTEEQRNFEPMSKMFREAGRIVSEMDSAPVESGNVK